MIPFYIERGTPYHDIRLSNVSTERYSSSKEKLNETIILHIVEFMYEFCGDCYHNIQISSYEDFVEQYWKIGEFHLDDFYNVFEVYYFENGLWVKWKIEDYFDEIFTYYKSYLENQKNGST